MCLCGLGSPCALLLDHNRLLALQNSAGTTQGSLATQIQTVKYSDIKTGVDLLEKAFAFSLKVQNGGGGGNLKVSSPCAGPSCTCSC